MRRITANTGRRPQRNVAVDPPPMEASHLARCIPWSLNGPDTEHERTKTNAPESTVRLIQHGTLPTDDGGGNPLDNRSASQDEECQALQVQ